ncbi:PREDICTED: vacuolar amino acid transporter 1-like [Ipomoea nil]|uniref:vacuolar amino acid transporter 1-like n=1 Tax=Ipomoea nil TaxID=35883 RepID=UPI000900E68E|nr:PREDICTED: vacuolar amino acid transporter 1-like [Ipomoea nil]
MKLDEEFGADRVIHIETDDEENEAETAHAEDDEDNDDTESEDHVGPRRNPSDNNFLDSVYPHWPQSYRQSMDMYTSVASPSVSILRGASYLTSPYRRPQSPLLQSSNSLSKPLFADTSCLNDEEVPVPTSTLPAKISPTTSVSHVSVPELTPRQECSYTQALINSINVLCGIGILATPLAVKEGGWLSLFLFLLYGIITCYTGILLKRCLESSPGLQTYPDIGQAAFGMTGRVLVAIILYLELYSSCIEFLIMMGDNLAALFPNIHMEFAGFDLNSYQTCAIISTLVILPTVMLRNLSLLSYISAGGVVTFILVIICLLWVAVTNDFVFHPSGTALNFAKLPVTVGIYSFCFGGHSVFPSIYSSMREPSRFPSLIMLSFLVAFVSFGGVAIFGFLMFGEATKSQFTLNLPEAHLASKVAKWTVFITPLTKYALTITPVALSIEEILPSNQHRSHGVSILIRTILVLSTLIVSLSIPYFGSVTALIGSALVMLVSLILPCACYIRISRDRITKFEITACTCIILLGLVSSIVGTYSALQSMHI